MLLATIYMAFVMPVNRHIERLFTWWPLQNRTSLSANNNKKRSHTQLDSRKQVIAFQDRVMTINIKEAQHPLK